MKVIKSLAEIDEKIDLGITIGNFDGLHKGHKEFFQQIKKDCSNNNQKLCVISFVPHPLCVLNGVSQDFLIFSYSEKREIFKSLNVDYLLELDFNRAFSELDPGEFLDSFILKYEIVKSFYLGHDFAFGAQKKGDHNFVKNYLKNKKINIKIEKEFKENNLNISSTSIREQIKKGAFEEVNSLLGRYYSITGRVIRGKGRGKQIGFPTANIDFNILKMVPKRGVYITTTEYKEMKFNSLTNVGFNPTFENEKKLNIETHILDFDNDIYGEQIKVNFQKRLREELKFQNVNELIRQIQSDVIDARKYFN